MSARVLLNLLNELRKRDKMRGLPSILSLFRNEFKKFNNAGARILDSIYHITLILLKNCISGVKTSRLCHLLRNIIMYVITQRYQICKPLVVYLLYCMALFHSQMGSHVINALSILISSWSGCMNTFYPCAHNC